MKQVVLKQITLTDWSSLNLRVNFNEGRTIISGCNGIGKTTVINAHRWLWTGRIDAIHPANYEVFDSRYPLTRETPAAIVEEVVSIDGCEYTIRKEAKAAFTKKDGVYVKASSDKYKTFVDDIEFTATQFNDWIEDNLCPTKQLPFVMDGIFFSTLCEDDKKKARTVLQELVGEILPEDFKGDYSAISELLKKYEVDQIKESASKKKKKLEDRAVEIENILKVKEADLSERKLKDYDSIKDEISKTKGRISNIDNEILGKSDSIKPLIEKRNAICKKVSDLEAEMQKARSSYNKIHEDQVSEIERKIQDVGTKNKQISSDNEDLKKKRENLKNEISRVNSVLEKYQEKIQELRDSRDEWRRKEFTETKCPVCGQELPYDKLEEAKARFNEDVRSHIHIIVIDGKRLAEKIKSTEDSIKETKDLLNKIPEYKPLLEKKDLEKELSKLKSDFVPFEDTEQYSKFMKCKVDLEKSFPQIPEFDNKQLTEEKKSLMERLDNLNQELGGLNEIKKLEKEISELISEQEDNGCSISEQEQIISQCKEWVEEKANIVSDRINCRLKDCSIQMWTVQKNGEKTPDCVILDKRGVKYGKTNTAERIKIDVELQEMFMSHYGVTLPVMIDEASVFSSFNIPKIDTQHLLIFASDDTKLIVE